MTEKELQKTGELYYSYNVERDLWKNVEPAMKSFNDSKVGRQCKLFCVNISD